MSGIFMKPAPSEAAQAIAREFLHGKIIFRDLDGHGISWLSVRVSGVFVRLSWYTNGANRSISIDGKTSIPDGRDSRFIFKAAKSRAKTIVKQDMAEIEAKLKEG